MRNWFQELEKWDESGMKVVVNLGWVAVRWVKCSLLILLCFHGGRDLRHRRGRPVECRSARLPARDRKETHPFVSVAHGEQRIDVGGAS